MVFLFAVVLSGGFLAGESLRVGAAAFLARSFDLSHLRLAGKLDPENPEIHRKLGLHYLDSMQDLNPQLAAAEFRLATQLSPFDAAYWSELAEACDSSRNNACADRALDHALKLSPMTPHFYWDSALHLVLTGRSDKAWPYFRRLLELDPAYCLAVLQLCSRSLDDPEFILQTIYPRQNSTLLKVDYINFLISHDKDDLAYTVWTRGLARDSSLAFPSMAFFLNALLQAGQVEKAYMVWQDLERLAVIQNPPTAGRENLVFNGDFERAPLNAGFDWRVQPSPYLLIDFESPGAYSGAHCLRVDFTVPRNDEFRPAYEFIPVMPNQLYRLTAYVRSDSITSDSGPRLRVVDPSCSTCLDAATKPTLATTPWHPVSLTFATGTRTRLIRLSVWRPRSRSFPFEITGTFWLDAVSLKPISVSRQAAFRQDP
ncbi:MAG: tetratricopeptide repeat protein [Terriglobia bacterium]